MFLYGTAVSGQLGQDMLLERTDKSPFVVAGRGFDSSPIYIGRPVVRAATPLCYGFESHFYLENRIAQLVEHHAVNMDWKSPDLPKKRVLT